MNHKQEIEERLRFYQRHSDDLSISLRELEAFYVYLKDPEFRKLWIYEVLLREAHKYRKKGIPRERWPRPLQAFSDKEINNRKMVGWQGNGHSTPQIIVDEAEIIEEEATINEPLPEVKAIRKGNPFASDGEGELLGENDRGQ